MLWTKQAFPPAETESRGPECHTPPVSLSLSWSCPLKPKCQSDQDYLSHVYPGLLKRSHAQASRNFSLHMLLSFCTWEKGKGPMPYQQVASGRGEERRCLENRHLTLIRSRRGQYRECIRPHRLLGRVQTRGRAGTRPAEADRSLRMLSPASDRDWTRLARGWFVGSCG